MRLETVGRVANPEALDLEPIVVPVAAYTADHREVVQEFSFRAMPPAGPQLDVLRMMDAQGEVPAGAVVRFLDACLLPEDAARWKKYLDDPALYIQQSALVELYRALMELYSARPTMPQPSSQPGPGSTQPTSPAAAPSRASTYEDSPFG